MAKRAVMLLSFMAVLLISGCIDPRMKREASLVNVMSSTAAEEFKKAASTEEKVKVAQDYFEAIPKHTQVIEDYCFGRNPRTGVQIETKEQK